MLAMSFMVLLLDHLRFEVGIILFLYDLLLFFNWITQLTLLDILLFLDLISSQFLFAAFRMPSNCIDNCRSCRSSSSQDNVFNSSFILNLIVCFLFFYGRGSQIVGCWRLFQWDFFFNCRRRKVIFVVGQGWLVFF
mmetsp:Transcript_32933/g.50357  ORF Transcript_32933/g.50357 Transcript_32933/m.50357 type:complete len:136 (-) Transcript_32933:1183-1590(-)